MTSPVTFEAAPEDAGNRLDALVAERIAELSRSLARKLVEAKLVCVNGVPAKPSRRIAPGDVITVEVELPPSLSAEPEEIPLTVVYWDNDLAVLDKPAGMVVHPAAGHPSGTLANALVNLFPGAGEVGTSSRPGIVHRLDKDTSGLMVVALTSAAQLSLQEQIASRAAERRYLALATGKVRPARGVIDAPIGRDPQNRKRMAVHGIAARPAQTSYEVREYLPGFTLLEARLLTGRTHQIRVHLAATGHPIAGDHVYHGGSLPGLERQFLHAYRLSIRSPSSGQELSFESPLPSDLKAVQDELRQHV